MSIVKDNKLIYLNIWLKYKCNSGNTCITYLINILKICRTPHIFKFAEFVIPVARTPVPTPEFMLPSLEHILHRSTTELDRGQYHKYILGTQNPFLFERIMWLFGNCKMPLLFFPILGVCCGTEASSFLWVFYIRIQKLAYLASHQIQLCQLLNSCAPLFLFVFWESKLV